MSFTVTARSTNANNSAGTQITFSPTANLTAGNLGVLCIAYDNSASGGADPYSSITDTPGNTWTPRINSLNDPGAANAGMTLRIFTSPLPSGLTTAQSITVNFGSSTTAKAWVLWEISSTQGTPKYVTGNQAAQTSATPSITTTSITSGNLVIAAVGREANGTRTADADTTNGSWSAAQAIGVGTTTGGAEIISQYKITTAGGAQTFNPTFGGSSADGCNAWIEIAEPNPNTASIPLGSITTSAQTPGATTSANNKSAVALGTITSSGLTPSAVTTENHKSAVPLGSLTISAQTPSASTTEKNFSALPVGSISISGLTPDATTTIGAGNTSSIPLGSVSVTGNAPTATVTTNHKSALPLSAITVTGRTPSATVTQNHKIALPLATITVSGKTPSATTTTGAANSSALPVRALTITGRVPTAVTTNHHKVALPLATISISGKIPGAALTLKNFIALPRAILSILGLAPEASKSESVGATRYTIYPDKDRQVSAERVGAAAESSERDYSEPATITAKQVTANKRYKITL